MVMMSSVALDNNVSGVNQETESKRDWGEERHDDVIYKVVLKKKVTQESSPSQNTATEECDGLRYATQKVRYIKGATLSHLIDQLCQSFVEENEWSETNCHTVFFSTYRTFTSSTEVLDLIVKEVEKLNKEAGEKRIPRMRSIIQILRIWLDRYFKEDFYKPPHHLLLKRFLKLAEEYKKDEELSDIFAKSEDECDFVTFIKSRLQAAEVKGLQEEACENMNSPSIFSDILDETENVCVEEESVNMEASGTFLNLLSCQQIAEQLTVKAANLLLRVVPHHCLDAVRSSKDKPATVKATIEQFNKVTYCVQGMCLCPGLKTSVRAKVISRWIEIAQACLDLNNFSSFHAIISGLNSHPIYRLKRTWQQVSSAQVNLFEELSQINIKDSLMKVKLTKKNPEKFTRGRKDATVKRHQTLTAGVLQGTVPYLGTFLTDLTYLHTANSDYIEKNFINFNKMRKEFEMLEQLQRWQASCRSYQQFESEQRFSDWFNSVTLPTDEEAIQLSDAIEPQNTISLSPKSPAPVKRALSEMLANQIMDVSGLSSSSFQPTHQRTPSNEVAQLNFTDAEQTPSRANGHIPETPSDQEQRTVQVQIIKKVTINCENFPERKEMELCSNDRSPAFMKKAFSLFQLDNEDAKSFTLVQILPQDKRLVIPETGNVFYAMNSSTNDYNFVLIEEGAEMPTEKKLDRTHTLPPSNSNKVKKISRKTASTSSMSSGVSPMKRSIYKHFGIASSTSYSPVKEIQKQENCQDRRESLRSMTPDPIRRKASADDSLTSSGANYSLSDDSEGESDSSRKMKSFKKLIGKRKGHRRNHSDLGQVSNPKVTDFLASLSIKMFQPITPSHEETSSPQINNGEGDPEEHNALYPSFSLRESKSLPVSKTNNVAIRVDQDTKADPKGSKTEPVPRRQLPKVLKKRESRSKFYIQFQAKEVSDSPSSSSVGSAESNDIKQIDYEMEPPSSPDSNTLELVLGENEVFGDEIKAPVITVQAPSPQKTSFFSTSNNTRPSRSKSDKKSVKTNSNLARCRRASETRTTPL